MTKEEALVKLQRYCTYQDRCHQEVRSKLLSIKIYGDWLEEVMSELIEQGYLCLLYTSPSPRDQRGSRMPSSA